MDREDEHGDEQDDGGEAREHETSGAGVRDHFMEDDDQ
jgi:hypothetical protein